MHHDAQIGDHPAQQGAAGLVELLDHQAGCQLDDVGLETELAQRVGGLKPEQTSADHHTHGGRAGAERTQRVGANRVEIVEGSIDVAGRQVTARHRRHERVRAGGQHQRVIAHALPVGCQHRLGDPVDLGDPTPQPHLDQLVAAIVVAGQCEQAAVPVLGVSGEPHPVVGGVGFLREHGHPPGAGGVARPQRLDEPMPNHAVADDHDV